MSKFVSVIVGAAVMATSFGVAQLATGQDLYASTGSTIAINQADYVNRSAKTDRAAGAVSVSKNELSRGEGKISARRPVACEAPASVLTDIAKQMASGRCIT